MNEPSVDDLLQQAKEQAAGGEYAQAAVSFRLAIERQPRQPVWVFVGLGDALLKSDQCHAARQVFGELVQDHPDTAQGYAGLAQACARIGDWQCAADTWEECVLRFPTDVHPAWLRGQGDALSKLRRFEAANAVLWRLANDWPDSPAGRVGLAVTAQRAGRWNEALDHWELCFEQYADRVQPFWHQGRQRSLAALGRLDRAVDEVRKQHQSEAARAYFSMLSAKKGSPAKSKLRYDSILVITYGRSGSTLLQGVLNSIDGVLIRGENENVFFDFFEAYRKLQRLKEKHVGAILPKQPWYGIGLFDETLLIERLRDTARAILLADRMADPAVVCYGFKEVRYFEVGADFEAYWGFLEQLFPNPAFIINTRNLDDVVKSAWWKSWDTEELLATLRDFETRCVEYAKTRSNCFQIDYDDVRGKGVRLAEMFDFLGAEYDPEVIDAVLATPHSYGPVQPEIQRLFADF